MPEVFYDMDLEDFFLMQKGFFNKRKDDSLQFAKVGFYIAAIHQNGLAGKPLSSKTFYQEWFGEYDKPVSKDQLDRKVERSKEIMNRVKYTNKILEEKEKIRKQIKDANKKMN